MRRLPYIAICLFLCMSVFAQYTPESYIETYAPSAWRIECEYGIPACIVLAQAILESGYGNSPAARLRNNHFGINHGRTRYGSAEECYEAYAVLLSTSPRYAPLFEIPESDYRGWAHGLQKCGYATDKRYAEKLIIIIERYGLSGCLQVFRPRMTRICTDF